MTRIVAELSANHLGSIGRAYSIMSHAKAAGADAVKIQTFTPEQMVDPNKVLQDGPWAGCNLVDLYRRAHVPREWHPELFACARELNIEIFSSVFHPDDVDFLETLGCPRYKIASFELTDHALIRHAAATRRPIIISTGMATLEEIAAAVDAAKGAASITLLRCVSAYPAQARDAHLATMVDMRYAFEEAEVGLSDHTMGIGVAVAAAVFGASMIEKHLTLARSDGGPDAGFSMEPAEFAQMVTECRRAVEAVGEVRYGPSAAEAVHIPLRRTPGGKRAA